MRIVVFVSQKGGSGKSTLACATAVAAQLDDERVALVDLDAQGSTAAWVEARNRFRVARPEGKGPPEIFLRRMEPDRIGAWIEEARKVKGRPFTIFIDTPGITSTAVTDALRNADAVVIPVQPSPQDIRALGPTMAQVREHSPGRFAIVLNRASPLSVRENADIIAALEKRAPVVATVMDRVEFKRAIGFGLGPHESASAGKAASDVDALWTYIKGKFNGTA